MRKSPLLLALLVVMFIASCRKEEEVLIPDNVAPPDGTVEDIVLESYINRSYISLLGRKPSDSEFALAFSPMRSADFSVSARKTFVNGLTSLNEYNQRMFDVGRILYLNAADTTEIRENRDFFNLLLTQPQYEPFWPEITIERDRLNEVLAIPADLNSNSIGFPEMHRRLVHNYIYDQINMGTQNFVISMFQNFLFRYPTSAELSASETMVNGFSATVFLENGRTKEDFIRIFLESGDYYEGQVRDAFLRLLYREPNTEEIEEMSVEYKASGVYEDLLEVVMSSDEFAGI